MTIKFADEYTLKYFVQNLEIPTADGLVGLCKLDEFGIVRMVICGNNWTENSGQVHQWCGAPSFYSRDLVRAFATWFFAPHGANRGVMLAPVRGDAPATLALNVRLLGFRVAYTVRDGYEVGVDMHLLEQRREECKWLAPSLSSFKIPQDWLPK